MTTVEEIRNAFKARYPDVDDDQFSLEQSGFIHEHPITAIGVVLISAVLQGNTDVDRLAEFTKYSKLFICAIAVNMENSHLWKDNKYDCAGWSCGNLLPRDENEEHVFSEHIQIAEGSVWAADAKSLLRKDACAVFWDIKRVS